MNSEDKSVAPSQTSWQQRISELRAILKQLRPDLVAAEEQLSEQLAEISSFEFLVRSRLEPLSRRLDSLQVEIEALQRELKDLRDGYLFVDATDAGELFQTWRASEEAGSVASGDFRYHEALAQAPNKMLSGDESEKLKQVYRQLARRFHPDFALDTADRAYRTGVMMAINAAYTAGDLRRLQELAEQPDPQRPDYSQEELADALLREAAHCQNRISEIEKELQRLRRHPSYVLKMRVEEVAEKDRDLLEELAAELRETIAGRMVQRDVLTAEIEAFKNGEPEFADDAFADAVFNLGLERAFAEEDDSGLDEWRSRNRGRFDFDDMDDDEEVWDGLRRARDTK